MTTASNPAAFDLLAGLPEDEIQDRIRAAMAIQSLATFVRSAWLIHHGSPAKWNWHIDCICEHLEATYHGQIEWLLMNIAPGFAKSLLVSVYFPAWVWAQNAAYQFLCSGASSEVVLRDARRHHEVCSDPWYQRAFLPQWEMLASQNAKGYFVNTHGGHRVSRTCKSAMTGLRGDCRILDDPLDAQKAYDDKEEIPKVAEWLDSTFLKRRNDQNSPLILIMQRLNQADPTGFLKEKGHQKTVHLVLPNEYRPEIFLDTGVIRRSTGKPWEDPRTKEGELLAPALLDEAGTAEERVNEYIYQAQYQQDPMPAGGSIFHRDDFRVWALEGSEAAKRRGVPLLPEKFDRIVLSIDPNNLKKMKATRNTDYAVLDVWGAVGRDRYLIRQVREKLGLGATIQLCMKAIRDYKPWKVYIERSANGPSVISAIKAELGLPDKDRSYVVDVSVQGESKQQRAVAASPIIEAGRVYVPDPDEYAEMGYWFAEICGFPGRRRDDRVDTMTMALLELEKDQGSQVWTIDLSGAKRR
jgi:predicted phage terminase large subunit-like protein